MATQALSQETQLLKQLKEECDFEKYIDILDKLVGRYCVFLASNDTPCGSPVFTEKLARKLCRVLGTKTLLHDKYRCTYIAVVDEGSLIHEKISGETLIEFRCEINKVSFYIKSEAFMPPEKRTGHIIRIDDVEYSAASRRGLFFVVYDKKKKKLIDCVAFDTYGGTNAVMGDPDHITAFFHARNSQDYEENWEEMKEANPGVIFIHVSKPVFPTNNLSENEEYIRKNSLILSKVYEGAETLRTPLYAYLPDADGIREVLSPPVSYHGIDGVRRFFDKKGRFVTIEDGHRITVGQPIESVRSIWCVGGCAVYGVGARDEGTIASALQKILNESVPEKGFIVHNYGLFLANTDREDEALSVISSLPIRPGDIVFCNYGSPTNTRGLDFLLDASMFPARPHNHGELFWDRGHLTEKGYELIARGVYDILREHGFFQEKVQEEHGAAVPVVSAPDAQARDYGFSPEWMEQLEAYKQILSNFHTQMFGDGNPRVGAIVMNCNPFTLGHRYLVEEASKRVDFLILFVVQEDKSFFPFEDRMALVDQGTEDLPNVAVIESGRFIISSLTFSEYFNKSELQDRLIDSSNDVTLFAREIAPAARISVRFVGTEPFDRVTKQYNDTLRHILPRYGIAFEELPRVELDGGAISASRVRKLLEEQDWPSIERLVPATTYRYLQEKFSQT